MKSNKSFDLSIAGCSGALIFIVNSIEITKAYTALIVPLIPFCVSLIAIGIEWCGLSLGMKSLSAMKEKESSARYYAELDAKIATCEQALQADITDSDKAKFQKKLTSYYGLKLQDVRTTLK
ncbi:hypothetical protein [Neptunicella sp. SCSIO 80796]|uniref:hypothetical protein n=1 Tax=Neptunicella plasticusilytica TaxID=3117012 RepID=UPI003A4DC860